MAIAVLPGAAIADALVVRSSGPSAAGFRPGTPIPDSQPIALKAGDTVTILDGRGTRTLTGPGSFSTVASAGTGPSTTRLAALTAQTSARRPRIGAVRPGCPAAIANTNIWNLDARKGGAFCVADPSRVQIFRAEVAAAGSAKISGEGKSETVTWAQCEGGTAWPASIPLEAGKSYTIAPAGSAPISVSVKLIGGNLAGLEDTASKLITNGCSAQLDVLIDAVAVPDDKAG